MTTITFDSLVTKRDLNDAFRDFNATVIAPIRTDLAVLKWMIGLSLAGSVSIVSLLLRFLF